MVLKREHRVTLGPLDDLMIHQTLDTLDSVASDDPRWMERFWFGVCDPEGKVGLICGLGTYPNAGMVDALALVRAPASSTTCAAGARSATAAGRSTRRRCRSPSPSPCARGA